MAEGIAFFAVIISLYAAYINEQKLRLDLYNRRFEVYSRTIDFYQALQKWERSKDNELVELKFIKAFLESRFLFKADVFQMLKEMRMKAAIITTFDGPTFGALARQSEDPKMLTEPYGKMTQALEYWGQKINPESGDVTKLMFEYLDFQELSPFRAIKSWLCKKCKRHLDN